MSLTLGREGGIAKPLKKRTVGQTNIAHVYDGANHIWPTSVIHLVILLVFNLDIFGVVMMDEIWILNHIMLILLLIV